MPSQLPEANVRPLGEKTTDQTSLEWPRRVFRCCPVSASQMITFPSALAIASSFPSGVKATSGYSALAPVSGRVRVFQNV